MKQIFIIDWSLIPVFLLTSSTGISLHLAGHIGNHELWRNWALAHIIASLLLTILITIHIKMHWGWYKSWFRNGLGCKSRVTAILSILFFITSITGFALLWVYGSNSILGLWHYRIGLFTIVLFGGHIIKRFRILRRS